MSSSKTKLINPPLSDKGWIKGGWQYHNGQIICSHIITNLVQNVYAFIFLPWKWCISLNLSYKTPMRWYIWRDPVWPLIHVDGFEKGFIYPGSLNPIPSSSMTSWIWGWFAILFSNNIVIPVKKSKKLSMSIDNKKANGSSLLSRI